MSAPVNSLVVPVFRNAETIDDLVGVVGQLARDVDGDFEAVFVVDGSPDDSHRRLLDALRGAPYPARVVEHSRNFGSFAAIRTGMTLAAGERIAVMAADLQEPPQLIEQFFSRLADENVDVVVGRRTARNDQGDTMSGIYWRLYKRFVMREIPAGGVDVFACTRRVRDVICSLEAVHTSLVAQLFWAGFKRETVDYERRPQRGRSGWTFRRKLRYLSDSVFAFTDLPVRLLWLAGLVGIVLGVVVGAVVLVARAAGAIKVPGYAATILVLDFFASLNLLGLGIIGSYVWRSYDTVKGRPGGIIRDVVETGGQRGE